MKNLKLLKYFIIVTLFSALTTENIFSQSPQYNLEKYWFYRERLRQRFIVVSPDVEESGVNIPATNLIFSQSNYQIKLDWDDGNSNMSHYLTLLATEYKLLKNNNQSYRETLKELMYALLALERLDLYSEKYRGRTTLEAEHLNGFLLRDDITPQYWEKYYKKFGFYSYKEENYGSIYKMGVVQKQGMSQDNIYHLLEGLSLIKALVGKEAYTSVLINFKTSFISDYLTTKGVLDGSYCDFGIWVDDLTSRLITNMQQGDKYQIKDKFGTPIIGTKWYIKYPYENKLVEEGSGSDFDTHFLYSYGLARTGNHITGLEQFHHDGSSNKGDLYRLVFEEGYFKQKIPVIVPLPPHLFPGAFYTYMFDFKFDDYKVSTLGAMGDVSGSSTLSYLRKKEGILPYEHFPLIYLLLHGNKYPNIYTPGSSDYNLDNNYYSELLNNAPCDGPRTFGNTYNANWSSTSRLVWPERSGTESRNIEYAGLDYMVLHNLYCLNFSQDFRKINSTITENDNFTNSNVTEQSINLIASNIISGGNVIYEAGKSITLIPGFSVKGNASFTAKITPTTADYNLNVNCDRNYFSLPPPLTLRIDGPSSLPQYTETGVWTVVVSNHVNSNFTYKWFISTDGGATEYEVGSNASNSARIYDYKGIKWRVEVSNGVQNGKAYASVYCSNCNPGTQPLLQSVIAAPNPSSEYLDVYVANEPQEKNEKELSPLARKSGVPIYRLYDAFSNLILEKTSEDKPFRINTQHLKDGYYYLHIIKGSSILKKTISIRH